MDILYNYCFITENPLHFTEPYSELCQTSKMELSPKTVNGFHYSLTIFSKSFILDV